MLRCRDVRAPGWEICRATEWDGVEDGFVGWDFEFVAGEGVDGEVDCRLCLVNIVSNNNEHGCQNGTEVIEQTFLQFV